MKVADDFMERLFAGIDSGRLEFEYFKRSAHSRYFCSDEEFLKEQTKRIGEEARARWRKKRVS